MTFVFGHGQVYQSVGFDIKELALGGKCAMLDTGEGGGGWL